MAAVEEIMAITKSSFSVCLIITLKKIKSPSL